MQALLTTVPWEFNRHPLSSRGNSPVFSFYLPVDLDLTQIFRVKVKNASKAKGGQQPGIRIFAKHVNYIWQVYICSKTVLRISICIFARKPNVFTTHVHVIPTSSVMRRYSVNVFLFILFFFNLYYSLTWLSRSWLVTTQIVVVPLYLFVSCYILHGFQRTSFSELIQTSQLLPRGGLQPCENYFGFAGRRSWQSFPSNSLSLAALNKVMEIFISSQTWNTDSIYKCQDCSENKVHIDFHKFHSRFFLHQPICKQIMC